MVLAHPDPDSFCAAACAQAVSALARTGHEVTVIDLYAEQFNPSMTSAERLAYETDQPILDPQVQRYADLVKSSEGLVFVYPTWWFGLPAMLKGFLDRVLVPGVSFVLDPATNKVKPGLNHVRHIVGITTYGSTPTAMLLFNDAGRRIIVRGVRLLAPLMRCRRTWLGLHRMDNNSPADRSAFLLKIDRVMGAL